MHPHLCSLRQRPGARITHSEFVGVRENRSISAVTRWVIMAPMNISIALPDDVAEQMRARWRDVPRRALEALAADAYRAGVISGMQVQRILGLGSRWDVERFLQEAGALLGYSEQELREDLEALRELPDP